MAASAMTPAQLELIESLSQDDIPIKLRCAICSKLAVNAFRLPCCEQAICENCQSNLPSSCPVCEHSPVTPDDCTPHKSLRTTIKVFLRTEEKKRGALLAKVAKETPPETPVEEAPPTHIPEAVQPESTENVAATANGQEETAAQETEANTGGVQDESFESNDSVEFILNHQDSQDIPQKSIEEIAPGQEPEEDKSNVDDASITAGEGDGAKLAVGAQAPNAFAMPGMGMNPMMGMMNGMGEMNQMQHMQMMMAMQSGMGGFGGFPMMGMPGMPMDPMTMQQMYMNGGFGNGMNGVGNMSGGGGFGGNGNGGYGQQGQSWNANGSGGDNFNANIAAVHNDFASSHYPNHGGFNRGGFGGRGGFNELGGHQGEFYGRGRGRGRGRGGFGRGGYGGHGGFDGNSNGLMNPMEQMKQMMGDQNQQVTSKENEDAQPKTNVDEFGREIRAATPEEGDAKIAMADGAADGDATVENANGDIPMDHQNGQYDQNGEYSENYGPGDYNQGYDMNGGYDQLYPGQGYGYNQNNMAQPPADIPINAPKGPKAMREGLPNTSLVHLKGRSGSFGRPYSSGSGANNIEVADRSARQYDKEREEYARQREERHKSRDKSRDRDEHRSSRRHRDRDEETSDDARESERRRERRRRRRKETEAAAAEEGKDTDTKDGDAVMDEDSESGSKRDSHRSSRRDKERSDRHSARDRHRDRSRHRDRDDKDRERSDRDRSDRDKEKSSRSSRFERHSKHYSSSHRHRDRDRSRSRSRDKEDSKSSRSSRRDRDRDSDRDRDGHHSRRHRDKDEQVPPVLKPPTGPRSMSIFDKGPVKGGGIQIKGASSRGKENPSTPKNPSIPKGPKVKDKEVDPHTAEREARNRERLLKEAQRMAGLAGLVGVPPPGPRGKREREDERGGRRKRRGRGDHGMDGADDERPDDVPDGEEERIRKNELEREGARGR